MIKTQVWAQSMLMLSQLPPTNIRVVEYFWHTSSSSFFLSAMTSKQNTSAFQITCFYSVQVSLWYSQNQRWRLGTHRIMSEVRVTIVAVKPGGGKGPVSDGTSRCGCYSTALHSRSTAALSALHHRDPPSIFPRCQRAEPTRAPNPPAAEPGGFEP